MCHSEEKGATTENISEELTYCVCLNFRSGDDYE
jgi:hypothetical protein